MYVSKQEMMTSDPVRFLSPSALNRAGTGLDVRRQKGEHRLEAARQGNLCTNTVEQLSSM